MALLLKNVHAIDPQLSMDQICDIAIRDGKIAEVGQGLSIPKGEVRDMAGKTCIPGIVDMHVHLRDPGQEHKEDIRSGTRAAAKGGVTAVCCMPNTTPTIDNADVVDYVLKQAAELGKCRVHVAGACTKSLAGIELSEMGDLRAHGAVAFTDDGRGVQDSGMMRRVMDYANQFGCAVMSHCQDEGLVGKGQVNEGVVSTRLGVAGWPAEGEELQIQRDIMLSRLTGTALHIQHISSRRGLDMVRRAKTEGLRVSCEVTPHHLFLNEDVIGTDYNTNYKVNPPLRTADDNDALVEGILDRTIDCIVTDHAPHAAWEKDCEFEEAPFGMTGLETSLGLVLTQLVEPGIITTARMVELMAVNPRRILGVEKVSLIEGSTADLTIFDPELEWEVKADEFESKSANSGFIGAKLTGRATDTYVGGYATMQDGVVLD